MTTGMTFETLVQQPESLRDSQWEAQFLDALIPQNVVVEATEAKPGPDGWPYFRIRTAADGTEPFVRLVHWLAGRGIGLAVNAHKMMPDYVFTYGMLWYFVQSGRFVVPQPQVAPGKIELTPGPNLLMGAPTEAYLPKSVRGILAEFLKAQGYADPKVLVVSTQDFAQIDLVFSIESLGNLPEAQHRTMAEALSWFMPLHYSLVLASEKDLPPFHAL